MYLEYDDEGLISVALFVPSVESEGVQMLYGCCGSDFIVGHSLQVFN